MEFVELLAPELTPELETVDFAEVEVVQPSSFKSLDVKVSLFECEHCRLSSHSATAAPCPLPPKSVIPEITLYTEL